MPLETATYIDGLVTTNPAASDAISTADDHLRLIKSTIKATFPNITGAVTATQAQINQPIPAGLIAMWSGAINAVPSGWALCNGSNGTPDLRDRFIVGAGSTYAVGNTGGAASVTLTSSQIPGHTHTGTTGNESASHTHTGTTASSGAHTHLSSQASSYVMLASGGAYANGWVNGLESSPSATTSSAGAHTHTFTTQSASNTHTHSFTTDSTGGGGSHENRPPYYALAYIMKL